MKISILIGLFIFLRASVALGETWVPAIEQAHSFPDLPKFGDPGTSDKFNKRMIELEKTSELPNEERVRELALTVLQGSIRPIDSPAAAAVYLEAQRLMMACDHPAETLVKWLEEQRSLRIKQTEEDKQGIHRREPSAHYDPSLVFFAIAQIPTPESVAVLGRYLSDRRDERDMEEFGGFSGGHFREAAYALNFMGLKNAPTRQRDFSPEDDCIQKWQQWFAEVEAGTRSFSFYGSDVEYRLKERTDAAGRKHLEAESVVNEESKQHFSETKGATTDAPVSSVWKKVAFAIASLLLLLGAWQSLKRRRAAA